ncbi:hypothetical protein [Actinomycetospora flava]|uniref:Uncharacterized protein n=1 Tax=Actinomycetospora flava TaxID=3129232 RepID=A0ABU8M152_9PSEU
MAGGLMMEDTTGAHAPTVAANGWAVVIAPLAGDRQGYGCPRSRVFVIDAGVPADAVVLVLDELVAAAGGAWDRAPHARRPAPVLVHSTPRPQRRSRRKRPDLRLV